VPRLKPVLWFYFVYFDPYSLLFLPLPRCLLFLSFFQTTLPRRHPSLVISFPLLTHQRANPRLYSRPLLRIVGVGARVNIFVNRQQCLHFLISGPRYYLLLSTCLSASSTSDLHFSDRRCDVQSVFLHSFDTSFIFLSLLFQL